MTQAQVKGQGRSVVEAPLTEGLSGEILHLLHILARIEARRQAKRRAAQKKEGS